jgi:hypothetical protein
MCKIGPTTGIGGDVEEQETTTPSCLYTYNFWPQSRQNYLGVLIASKIYQIVDFSNLDFIGNFNLNKQLV